MKTKLVIIEMLVILTGCSKNILIPATYVEKHDKNVVRFVNEEYKFKKENKFEYKYWSDDLNSSRYGVGDYKLKKHRLILEFTDESLPKPKSSLIGKVISIADSSQNFYQVQVKTDTGINLPGVTILLINVNNEIITGTATNINGIAEFVFLKKSIPKLLKVSFIGYEDVDFELDHNESLYFEVTLAQKIGTRIINKQTQKRIKIKNNRVLIDGKEYEKAVLVNNI